MSLSSVVRRAVAPKGNALEDLKIMAMIASKHILQEGEALRVVVGRCCGENGHVVDLLRGNRRGVDDPHRSTVPVQGLRLHVGLRLLARDLHNRSGGRLG